MTSLCTESYQSTTIRAPFRPRPVQTLRRLLATWQARREGRAALRKMSDYLLRDIGLSVADVVEETRKPFWKP